jgi:small subunit ribosomal protein S8
MSLSDPIADMLTRIRNGHRAGSEVVVMPHSVLKGELVRLLKREGYIADYAMEGNVKKVLRVFLKYGPRRQPAIHGIRRASHAGRRTYVRSDRIPRVLDGLGIAILSTSVGVLTDREARKRHVGGELICTVW